MFAILPFSLISISLLYLFGERNFRDGRLKEKLEIFPKKIILQRADPAGRTRSWSANPFWIQVNYYKNGPIENYLTIRGNGKEVEVANRLVNEIFGVSAIKCFFDLSLKIAFTVHGMLKNSM